MILPIRSRSSVLRRLLRVILRMAYDSDKPSLIPNFNRGISARSKSSFRLFQGGGIRRAFNDFRVSEFTVVVEQEAAVSHNVPSILYSMNVAGAHRSGDAAASWQAATRDMGEVRHGQRRTSSVLAARRQVQPVSLQTRSSPAPGAPWL